jgi:hypothetical protein
MARTIIYGAYIYIWPEPLYMVRIYMARTIIYGTYIYGQNHYIWCAYGILGWIITKHMVYIYGSGQPYTLCKCGSCQPYPIGIIVDPFLNLYEEWSALPAKFICFSVLRVYFWNSLFQWQRQLVERVIKNRD